MRSIDNGLTGPLGPERAPRRQIRKEAPREREKSWHEMRKFKSTTYTKTNFEQIETAIGTTLKPVADLEAQFEAAALWFRLDKGRPKLPAPSKQHEKLTQVAKNARRLLK